MNKSYRLNKTELFVEQFYQQIQYYTLNANENIALNFIDRVNETVEKIKSSPLINSRFISEHEQLRNFEFYKKKVDRFPFIIFFTIKNDTVIIQCMYMDKRDIDNLLNDKTKSYRN